MKLPETFESHRVDVDGWPIHYVASNLPVAPDPPVVLVHGVGLSHRYLMPYAERLAREYHVFVPDLPGFGLSEKPDRILRLPELAHWLGRWMSAVGLERAAMFGNSVGCQIIVDLALQQPHRVLRAILQGPTTDPQALTFPRQMWRWYLNRRAERSSDKGPIVAQDYRECGVKRLVRTFRYAMEDRIERKLPRVRCPTLVVRGALDPIVPQRWAEEVTNLLPDARLLVLPGVPHTANLEAPLELMRVTRPFLEEERRVAHRHALDAGVRASPSVHST